MLRNQKHKGPAGGVAAGFKGEHHNTFSASHHGGIQGQTTSVKFSKKNITINSKNDATGRKQEPLTTSAMLAAQKSNAVQ